MMTINWIFISIVAIVIASLVELVKKIPIFSRTWKFEGLRSFCIWIIAFLLSAVVTFFTGYGFGISEGWAAAISYTAIAFFLQKFLGEEFFHKVLTKSAGVSTDTATTTATTAATSA